MIAPLHSSGNMSIKKRIKPNNEGYVFISYSRKDSDFVKKLEASLKARSKETWVDWMNIEPSVEWKRSILDAIDLAHDFIFVITPDSCISQVCMEELSHAIRSHKKIIPLLARPIVEIELPEANREQISSIKRLNFINFRQEDDFERSIALLIRAIETDFSHVSQHTEYLRIARVWEVSGKQSSRLIRGESLELAEHWLTAIGNKNPAATPLQIEFIRQSRLSNRKRRQALIAALSFFLVAVTVTASIAIWQWNEAIIQRGMAEKRQEEANRLREIAEAQTRVAEEQRAEAVRERTRAESEEARSKNAQAKTLYRSALTAIVSRDPESARSNLAEAFDLTPDDEKLKAAMKIYDVFVRRAQLPNPAFRIPERITSAITTKDGSHCLAVDYLNQIYLIDLGQSPEPVARPLSKLAEPPISMAISTDSSRAVVLTKTKLMKIDLTSRTLSFVTPPTGAEFIAVDPTAQRFLGVSRSTLYIWDCGSIELSRAPLPLSDFVRTIISQCNDANEPSAASADDYAGGMESWSDLKFDFSNGGNYVAVSRTLGPTNTMALLINSRNDKMLPYRFYGSNLIVCSEVAFFESTNLLIIRGDNGRDYGGSLAVFNCSTFPPEFTEVSHDNRRDMPAVTSASVIRPGYSIGTQLENPSRMIINSSGFDYIDEVRTNAHIHSSHAVSEVGIAYHLSAGTNQYIEIFNIERGKEHPLQASVGRGIFPVNISVNEDSSYRVVLRTDSMVGRCDVLPVENSTIYDYAIGAFKSSFQEVGENSPDIAMSEGRSDFVSNCTSNDGAVSATLTTTENEEAFRLEVVRKPSGKRLLSVRLEHDKFSRHPLYSLSLDGKFLAVRNGSDHQISIYLTSNGSLMYSSTDYPLPGLGLMFHPNIPFLSVVTGYYRSGGRIRIIDFEAGQDVIAPFSLSDGNELVGIQDSTIAISPNPLSISDIEATQLRARLSRE